MFPPCLDCPKCLVTSFSNNSDDVFDSFELPSLCRLRSNRTVNLLSSFPASKNPAFPKKFSEVLPPKKEMDRRFGQGVFPRSRRTISSSVQRGGSMRVTSTWVGLRRGRRTVLWRGWGRRWRGIGGPCSSNSPHQARLGFLISHKGAGDASKRDASFYRLFELEPRRAWNCSREPQIAPLTSTFTLSRFVEPPKMDSLSPFEHCCSDANITFIDSSPSLQVENACASRSLIVSSLT
ncbi:hypothetical protein BDY24DRAFT_372211 [Mrakia frigida]|uniref:uncharacterized protein n=1 Tax=Mrakia frigida TaxID=29902 RepID=UPI003FCC02B2